MPPPQKPYSPMPKITSRHPEVPSKESVLRKRRGPNANRSGRFVVVQRDALDRAVERVVSEPMPKPQADLHRRGLVGQGVREQDLTIRMHESDPQHADACAALDALRTPISPVAGDQAAPAHHSAGGDGAQGGLEVSLEGEPVETPPAPPRQGGEASDRLRRNPPAKSRRESMLRLLNARGLALGEILMAGDMAAARVYWNGVKDQQDGARHRLAGMFSGDRTRSSTELRKHELEEALDYLKHELGEHGYDFEAADAAYQQREADRLAQTAMEAQAA